MSARDEIDGLTTVAEKQVELAQLQSARMDLLAKQMDRLQWTVLILASAVIVIAVSPLILSQLRGG